MNLQLNDITNVATKIYKLGILKKKKEKKMKCSVCKIKNENKHHKLKFCCETEII